MSATYRLLGGIMSSSGRSLANLWHQIGQYSRRALRWRDRGCIGLLRLRGRRLGWRRGLTRRWSSLRGTLGMIAARGVKAQGLPPAGLVPDHGPCQWQQTEWQSSCPR